MSMIKQVYHENEMTPWKIDMIDEITLISQLRKYLQQKRYVVVFDDVWKIEFWEIVKHALPCNDRESRIIITTRSDLIGASCKESLFDLVHKLQPLSQDKAWELFCRKAFQSEFQRRCPKELVKLLMDIVKKCEGLPLAIVAIGGLLSTKEKVPLEWKKLHDSLSFELESKLFKKFKLLKVLDFEDAPIDYLPQEEHPLSCVQALPNLLNLSFNQAYDGEQLHFEKDDFRRLKRLTLREMKKLKMVEIDRGSLPSLEQLEIGPCPQMKKVPAGIQHLKSLKILDFYEMDKEFVLRMQPDEGEDYWKVKKVTTIHLRYRIIGERYQIYKLGDSNLLERLQGSNMEDQIAM
ncbi:hypothetical protein FH972_001276 [Carpinus fangiana]|uniref:NB-ARC domain-containing protein n=1 Tax=Carpinus fangiana TaxID=176857 RepID=A0A5N6QDW1_9ROSI|nr:hypothetical protein FH972_001276 [Carpinus fangiana]